MAAARQWRTQIGGWLARITVVGLGLLALWFAYGGIVHDLAGSRAGECAGHLGSLLHALSMYCADYEQLLPPGERWCDAVAPYVADTSIFLCPESRTGSCSYALNAAVGGRSLDELSDPGKVVILFESDAGWNGVGGPELLPTEPRHFIGDEYGFADGLAHYLTRRRAADGTYAKEPVASWVRWEMEE